MALFEGRISRSPAADDLFLRCHRATDVHETLDAAAVWHSFSDFAAVIVGALIVGKVVLIVDHLPFVNKFPGKPLMYNVAWKTMIYVLAAFLVRFLENFVPLVIKYGSFREAMARVVGEVVWPHFWVIYLWLSVLLFVYCSLRELIRAIGKDQVLKLFFGMERA